MGCLFLYADENGVCKREPYQQGNAFCIFHIDKGVPGQQNPTLSQFQSEISRLIDAGDGNWREFRFPKGFVLEGKTIGVKIEARHARFGSATIRRCEFKESVDFSDGAAGSTFTIEGTGFHKGFVAGHFNFQGDVFWGANVTGTLDLSGSVFVARAFLRGSILGRANFSNCSFGDVARFSGHWAFNSVPGGTNFDRGEYLFNGGADFSGVDFKRPDGVRFSHVDLRAAIMADANFDSVKFVGVKWYKFGRRSGLYDEKLQEEKQETHSDTKDQELPALEATYRSIRLAIEGTKNFDTASDFYIGEMEAKRKQLSPRRGQIFSILAMYRLLSGYGCEPGRAFGWLIGGLIAYGCAWATVVFGCLRCGWPDLGMARDAFVNTIWVLPVLRPESANQWLTGVWPGVFGLARLLLLVQIALFVLALRGRIKRG